MARLSKAELTETSVIACKVFLLSLTLCTGLRIRFGDLCAERNRQQYKLLKYGMTCMLSPLMQFRKIVILIFKLNISSKPPLALSARLNLASEAPAALLLAR